MWLLTDTLGTAAIFGLLIPFVFMLLSQLVVQRMVKTQKELMQATDTRLALSNEFLGAMKHIKLMAQEGAYAGKLLQARQREMVVLRKNHMTKIWLDILTATGAGFTLVASLFWYTKVEGRELSASTAFSSVLLTEVLRRSTQVSQGRPHVPFMYADKQHTESGYFH